MANEQNLVRGDDVHKFTHEEASRGGKASAEARRRKRDMKRAFEALLEQDFTDSKTGQVLSGAEALAAAMFKKAMEGNVKAFNAVRDTSGQAPVQKIETVNITQEALNDVQELIDGITEGCAESLTDDTE